MMTRLLWLAFGLALYVLPLVTAKPASGQGGGCVGMASIEGIAAGQDQYVAGTAVRFARHLWIATEGGFPVIAGLTALYAMDDGPNVLIVAAVAPGFFCRFTVPRAVYERARRVALGTGA